MQLNSPPQWNELTAQQLVRYEALFSLLDGIQSLEDPLAISRRVATRWKYFANVSSFRLAVARDPGFLLIDGFRGDARVAEVDVLPDWDAWHWRRCVPCRVPPGERFDGPRPPDHLTGPAVADVHVLPFLRMERPVGLLSAAARSEPFSELDQRFIRLFGGHFTDHIFNLLLQRQTIATLTRLATHDPLTGLLNRGAVLDRLASLLAAGRRSGQSLSVIMADLDHFKAINDSHGHQAGDEVLVEVARRLGSLTRDGELLGRYGGEEFLFVLHPCSTAQVGQAAERFRRAVAEAPVLLGGTRAQPCPITISLGCATADGTLEMPAQSLLQRADAALYRSKADGRNRVTLAGS